VITAFAGHEDRLWQSTEKQEKLNVTPACHLFHAMDAPALDRTDRRLLTLLQRNNRRPLRALADELGISAPTCLRRMRRLQSLGVIRRHAALLDAGRIGLHVTAHVEVRLMSPSGAEMTGFERRMQRCPEVVQCSELAGDVDYLITVVVRDMPTFAQFTRLHLANDKRVREYRSLLVLRQTKQEHMLPIQDSSDSGAAGTVPVR
jgi:Lrp/AsnC family leucine-responsive transcriptional regulator